jgi:hypothetical protein
LLCAKIEKKVITSLMPVNSFLLLRQYQCIISTAINRGKDQPIRKAVTGLYACRENSGKEMEALPGLKYPILKLPGRWRIFSRIF